MSILTQRTALVLQLAQLDASLCKCGHKLSAHLPSMRGPQSFGCNHFDFKAGKQVFCKCKEWAEPADVLL